VTPERAGGSKWLPWIALALAFSPVLLELGEHLASEPWTRYAALFPLLLARAAAAAPRRPEASASGYAWIAAGAAVEIAGVGGGIPRFARPGLALAVIGLCRARGIADLRVAALALWMIPLPSTALGAASPALETALLRPAAWLGRSAGLAERSEPPGLAGADGALLLQPPDGGLPLAALLSGLGWYAALRAGEGTRAGLARAAGLGIAAFPLQALALVVGAGVLALGAPRAAELALRPGLWPLAAAAGVLWAERRSRVR
jgi:hypothetical protein